MLKVREGYKITELGEIPVEWEVKSIGEFTTVKTGSTPLRSNTVYWENGHIPWMTSGEVNNKFINKVKEYITELGFQNSNTNLLPRGTVMMAMNGQGKTRGTVAYLNIETTCNQSLAGILPDKKFSSLYLYYYLEASYEKLRSINGEGRNGLNLNLIKSFKVSLPQLKEQQKIAEILSSVDTQIKKTKQAIEKMRELKNGLMQQLLTKGIGHTEFKQSELGEIPVEWEVQSLDDISVITRLAGAEYTDYWQTDENGSIITLRGFNIGQNKLKLFDVEKISEELSNKLNRSKLYKGDIVFPCVGTLGNATMITEDNCYHINQNIAKITPIELMDSLYLTFFLMGPHTKNEIKKYNTSSSQPNVLVGNLRRFKIAIPSSIEEQQKIAEIISTVDTEIDSYEQEKAKYEELKKCLMQQLLTGKIRVKVDA